MDPRAVTRFGDLADAAAARWGDREALVFGDRRYTFRQIASEVDRVARGLIHLGVRPGEKVAIWLLNCPEWIFAMFALAKIGAVHVPINTRLRTVGLAQVLEGSNATTLITHDVSGPVDYLGMVRELAALDDSGRTRRVRSASLPASVAPDDLIAFCRGRIAGFKIPRRVFVVDELPLTSSGKVQKARLRDEARERLG